MKYWRQTLIGILACLLLLSTYLFVYEPQYAGTIPPWTGTEIYAHRGFGSYAPDNSKLAVEIGLQNGFTGFDLDGQFTRDGELIIYHDLSVDRLTSGTGKVANKTLAEMLTLDLAPKFNSSLQGAYVATFEDVLKTIDGKAVLMVELKVTGLGETGIEQRAASIIEKYDAYDTVYLSSFNPIVLYRLKQIDPRIKTVLIFMDTNWNPALLAEIPNPDDRVDLPWMIRQEFIRRAMRKIIKPDLLSVNHEVDPATRARLIEHGWPVFLWTPNDSQNISHALEQQPFGLITDEPVLARELLIKGIVNGTN